MEWLRQDFVEHHIRYRRRLVQPTNSTLNQTSLSGTRPDATQASTLVPIRK
jgi:hypothetical protein